MKRIYIGISDLKISNDPDSMLITHALGSCIGIGIYDPAVRVGGMLHYLLPESRIYPTRAKEKPLMFGDLAIPRLFKASYRLGAVKERLHVFVVGGAQILDENDQFAIGNRNQEIAKKLLTRNNVPIHYWDVGGKEYRDFKLSVGSGEVWIKLSGQDEKKVSPDLKMQSARTG